MLKHTQGIIIPLVQVTVGFGEDCSVWLHKTNNRSKVHELQIDHTFTRNHRDTIKKVNLIPGCTEPCTANHLPVMYLKVKTLPPPMGDLGHPYSKPFLVPSALTVCPCCQLFCTP